MPQRLSREFTVDRTVQGQREAGELARNVRARVTYGRPMIDSELTPQLYQTLPVENRELIPGVRAAIPRAVVRRSTAEEDWREQLAERIRQEQGGIADSLRYARVLEASGSQTQRRERRAEAQQQNTVRNMLNLPTRLMLTDGNVMTTVREPSVVIEVD